MITECLILQGVYMNYYYYLNNYYDTYKNSARKIATRYELRSFSYTPFIAVLILIIAFRLIFSSVINTILTEPQNAFLRGLEITGYFIMLCLPVFTFFLCYCNNHILHSYSVTPQLAKYVMINCVNYYCGIMMIFVYFTTRILVDRAYNYTYLNFDASTIQTYICTLPFFYGILACLLKIKNEIKKYRVFKEIYAEEKRATGDAKVKYISFGNTLYPDYLIYDNYYMIYISQLFTFLIPAMIINYFILYLKFKDTSQLIAVIIISLLLIAFGFFLRKKVVSLLIALNSEKFLFIPVYKPEYNNPYNNR